jgi:hypothetical protein
MRDRHVVDRIARAVDHPSLDRRVLKMVVLHLRRRLDFDEPMAAVAPE